MKYGAALGAALVLGAGLALGACGAQSTPSTTTTTPASTTTVASATTPTVTTATYTVLGTTPLGTTLTQTVTHVTTTPPGPQGVALESGPPLGETDTTIAGQTIDAIQCNRISQLAFQAYAHLQIYVDGRPRALPGGIGLVNPSASSAGTATTYRSGLCAYWLATTTANGIIAVHAPRPGKYTLGDFFDIWGQRLSSRNVASVRGRVSATLNGRAWRGNPRGIPLREHASIQLAVGRPVPPPKPIDWSQTGL